MYRRNPSPVPQMNARQPLGFQRPSFSQQVPQKSNLEEMRSMLLEQKQDEYINQLAFKVDVLTTYSKMLEA